MTVAEQIEIPYHLVKCATETGNSFDLEKESEKKLRRSEIREDIQISRDFVQANLSLNDDVVIKRLQLIAIKNRLEELTHLVDIALGFAPKLVPVKETPVKHDYDKIAADIGLAKDE